MATSLWYARRVSEIYCVPRGLVQVGMGPCVLIKVADTGDAQDDVSSSGLHSMSLVNCMQLDNTKPEFFFVNTARLVALLQRCKPADGLHSNR
jgi:hypothetical protein